MTRRSADLTERRVSVRSSQPTPGSVTLPGVQTNYEAKRRPVLYEFNERRAKSGPIKIA